MRWYKKLYVGPSVVDSKKIQKKAALGMGMVGVYYITLASLPGNLLDIFHNGMLKQPLFLERQCTDIMELYQQTGGFDVRCYFKEEDFEDD